MTLNRKPFLYIEKLTEDGSFSIPLPSPPLNNNMRIEVQRLCTYLPVPDQDNKHELCSGEGELVSKISESNVRKLEINSNYGVSVYNYDAYFSSLKRKLTGMDNSIKTIYEGMWDENDSVDPLNMFNDRRVDDIRITNIINDMYNYFKNNDFVLLLEYGLYLNAKARCNTMKSVRSIQPTNDVRTLNYGMKNFQTCAYGFNVGFKYVASETQPDTSNSYFWTKLTNEIFDTPSDYSLMDMIRYALLDFGGYELLRIPSTANFAIRRQGFGFIIQFLELDTFLSLTVTAGRLPYIIREFDDNKISLEDRDYLTLTKSQSVCVLRKTASRVRPEAKEYTVEYATTLSKYYNEDRYRDNRARGTRLRVFAKPLLLDYIYDSALSTEPLFDMYRYGLNTLLPVYGGLSLFHWIFYSSFYYVGVLNIDIDRFFITPMMIMNMIAGNLFPYQITHAMYPYHIESETSQNPMFYLLNPELQNFIRLVYLLVKRDRNVSERAHDVVSKSFDVIGLDMELSGEKLIINGDLYKPDSSLLQTYFQSIEEYPNTELSGQNAPFVALVSSKKNIIITDPFSTTISFSTNKINPRVGLRFVAYDESLRKKSIKFTQGDKVMIKGQFIWSS